MKHERTSRCDNHTLRVRPVGGGRSVLCRPSIRHGGALLVCQKAYTVCASSPGHCRVADLWRRSDNLYVNMANWFSEGTGLIPALCTRGYFRDEGGRCNRDPAPQTPVRFIVPSVSTAKQLRISPEVSTHLGVSFPRATCKSHDTLPET